MSFILKSLLQSLQNSVKQFKITYINFTIEISNSKNIRAPKIRFNNILMKKNLLDLK